MSPMRGGHQLPAAALEIGGEIRPLVESNYIEFMELMTPDKMMDV